MTSAQIVYDNPESFWKQVSPHLRKNEAKNSLCLGLSHSFISNRENCLYQSALFENDQLLGALVCSRHETNRNLLPTPIATPKVAQALFEKFRGAGIPISAVVGESTTVKEYAALIHEAGLKSKVHVKQGIYRCNKVIVPSAAADIIFRKAELRDAPTIGEWVENFRNEAVPHDPPVNGLELAASKIKKEMIYVAEKAGRLVSMAGWGRDIGTSCSVNLVFTPKSFRKNGYASLVTAKLTQLFLSGGKKEVNLYTDMSNPTSNKIYQEIGFEFVCDSIHLGVF